MQIPFLPYEDPQRYTFRTQLPSIKLDILLLHSSSFLPHVNSAINSKYWRREKEKQHTNKRKILKSHFIL